MTDPTTATAAAGASFTGGMIILLGPVIGPWVAVILASFAGGMWAIGKADTETRLNAFVMLVRIVMTALVLTGAVATLAADYLQSLGEHILPAVAFSIGLVGDKFGLLREVAFKKLRSVIGGQS